jgi:hypothetical protein
MCIHRSDPTICSRCQRPKEVLYWKDSDPVRIRKYHDGKYERMHINIGYTKIGQLAIRFD